MRILVWLVPLMIACGGDALGGPNGGGPTTGNTPVGGDSGECGPKTSSGLYSCAYLTGSCATPGTSCLCWERGTMVCQADQTWSLILDGGCPARATTGSLEGVGCLGARTTCHDYPNDVPCTCDETTHVYHCEAIDMASHDGP